MPDAVHQELGRHWCGKEWLTLSCKELWNHSWLRCHPLHNQRNTPKTALLAKPFPSLPPVQTHGSRSLVFFTSAGNAEATTPAATSSTHANGFTVPYQTPKWAISPSQSTTHALLWIQTAPPQLPTTGISYLAFLLNLAQLGSANPDVFAWFLYQCLTSAEGAFSSPYVQHHHSQNNRNQPENNNNNNKGGRRSRPGDVELQTYPALTEIQEKHKEVLGEQAYPAATRDRSELQPEECAGLPARLCLHSPAGGATRGTGRPGDGVPGVGARGRGSSPVPAV